MRKSPSIKRSAVNLVLGLLPVCGAHAAEPDALKLAQHCMGCRPGAQRDADGSLAAYVSALPAEKNSGR